MLPGITLVEGKIPLNLTCALKLAREATPSETQMPNNGKNYVCYREIDVNFGFSNLKATMGNINTFKT